MKVINIPPEIEKKLAGLPQPDRWVVVDGQTGDFLHVPPELNERMRQLLDYRQRNPDTIAIPEYDGARYGSDYWLYVVGDVAEGMKIKGRHTPVFVEGKLGKNASIKVVQGIVSVASLGEGAHVSSYYSALVDSIKDSARSKNIAGADRIVSDETALILETKKGTRREIFAQSFGGCEKWRLAYSTDSSGADSLEYSLRMLRKKKFITGGFVSDADQARVLRKAGVPEIDPTQKVSAKIGG
jgi:hypothetical protein